MKNIALSIAILFLILPIFSQNKKALVGGTLIDGFGGTPLRRSQNLASLSHQNLYLL